MVLCGENADKIEKAIRDSFGHHRVNIGIAKTKNFELAVKGAFAMSRYYVANGKHVSIVLSPSGTSFDMFKNYEAKGRKFKEIVRSIQQ